MWERVKGDFLGFTFNGVHSSDYGIVRTSSSNRYNENLTPTIQDSVIDLNNDGQLFNGANHRKREISVPFAFDGLTEMRLHSLKLLLGDKKIHPLIFDELPYRVFYAKTTGVGTVKHIAFVSDNGERYYSGEGTINFTCYFPYARSRYEYSNNYTISSIPEWSSSSISQSDVYMRQEDITDPYTNVAALYYGIDEPLTAKSSAIIGPLSEFESWLDDLSLLVDVQVDIDGNQRLEIGGSRDGKYDNHDEWLDDSGLPDLEDCGYTDNTHYNINNAGDLEMPFKLWYELPSAPQTISFSFGYEDKAISVSNLRNLNEARDAYCIVDPLLGIIQGYDSAGRQTGTIYNEFITQNNLLTIPTGESVINVQGAKPQKIEFNYLYL